MSAAWRTRPWGLSIAVEGIICVLMAAPFAAALAAFGGALGYAIPARHWRPRQTPAMFSILILLVPASFGVEHAAALRLVCEVRI